MSNNQEYGTMYAYNELGSILGRRVHETCNLFGQALGFSATITPAEFSQLLQTYNSVTARLEAITKSIQAIDSLTPEKVSELMNQELPEPVVIKLRTYGELSAFAGMAGLGLTVLSASISIQLPLQGHMMDIAGISKEYNRSKDGAPQDARVDPLPAGTAPPIEPEADEFHGEPEAAQD